MTVRIGIGMRYNKGTDKLPRRDCRPPERDRTRWRCTVSEVYQLPLFAEQPACRSCGEADWGFRKNGKRYCKECNRRRGRRNRQREAYRQYMRDYLKEWHEQNPAKRGEYNRGYRERHPDRVKEDYSRRNATPETRARKAAYDRSERGKQAHADYYEANREPAAKQARERYEANREQKIEQAKEWRKANPEKRRSYNQKRRARALAAGGAFSAHEWLELCEIYGNRCLACGSDEPLTVDHVVPLSCGGHNGIENIQPLCSTCNGRKGTRTIDYRGGSHVG